jgi:hypothetical protein
MPRPLRRGVHARRYKKKTIIRAPKAPTETRESMPRPCGVELHARSYKEAQIFVRAPRRPQKLASDRVVAANVRTTPQGRGIYLLFTIYYSPFSRYRHSIVTSPPSTRRTIWARYGSLSPMHNGSEIDLANSQYHLAVAGGCAAVGMCMAIPFDRYLTQRPENYEPNAPVCCCETVYSSRLNGDTRVTLLQ